MALFFTGLLLLQSFSAVVIYAGFKANQDYIAAKLCENREKPQMHCHGKCYLEKQLQQESEKQEKAPAWEGPVISAYLPAKGLALPLPAPKALPIVQGGGYRAVDYPSPTRSFLKPPA